MSSARDWTQFSSGRPGLGLSPHHQSSRTPRDGPAAHLSSVVRLPQTGRCVCGCSLSYCDEGLGGRYVVVGVLSALEANIRSKKVIVYRSEVGEVRLAEIPSHTPVQQGVITLILIRRTVGVDEASSTSYRSRLNRS